ncbi:DUF4192 domain-containing protein [Petropleomorpha daqingensis]|uniref:DUF4192 domain-containing protein n=1 Tax=Petropleomorpha daqingensis TaxID=2026353 RepID=A0A853CBI6_9ACTN|nr:DUF4192 domain-containing protein [Petropleomorpha daqingensis]NYJ03758.1 hypothetical protein [Petropleomorpha daqingensis]
MSEHEYEVRISDPGEVAAALPHLLGFRPEESVVVVGLGGPSGGRVGLTVRADLPPPPHAVPLAAALARGIATDDPAAVVIAVVSEHDDELDLDGGVDLPHRDVVHALVVTLAEAGIPVRDALLVRDRRWWSYDCPHECCAPGAGTPLPGGVSALEAASVATGQVLAQSREELDARITHLDRADREEVREACFAMVNTRTARAAEAGWGAVEKDAWAVVESAVRERRVEGAVPPLPPPSLAEIVWGLQHTGVRDRALGLALGDDAAAAEALWTECTRRAPWMLAAAPATLLAVSAWLRGDGAMASVALERALGSDEDYQLAQLLRSALAACMRPDELRAMVIATLDRLDAVRPAG